MKHTCISSGTPCWENESWDTIVTKYKQAYYLFLYALLSRKHTHHCFNVVSGSKSNNSILQIALHAYILDHLVHQKRFNNLQSKWPSFRWLIKVQGQLCEVIWILLKTIEFTTLEPVQTEPWLDRMAVIWTTCTILWFYHEYPFLFQPTICKPNTLYLSEQNLCPYKKLNIIKSFHVNKIDNSLTIPLTL